MIPRPVLLVATLLVATSVSTSEGSRRRKRSDDGSPLEAVVTQLSQQVNTLTAQLAQQANTFNAQLTQMNTEIAALKLKTASLDKVVAFYAWNSANPIHATAHGTLIFDHASTNQGNAYDTITGVFTAPTSGLYYFQTVFVSYNLGPNGAAHAGIYVDSQLMAEGISDTNHGYYDQTTINVILHLNAGQKVNVKNPDGADRDYWDYITSPHTTFSGFLINEG